MVDFTGRSRDAFDDAQRIGQYYGELDDRAHQRGVRTEAWRRLDEANRLNRAQAAGYQQRRAGDAALFDDGSGMLGRMTPRNTPTATPPGPPPEEFSGGPGVTAPVTSGAPVAPRQNTPYQTTGRNYPQLRGLTPEQRAAWLEYHDARAQLELRTQRDGYTPRSVLSGDIAPLRERLVAASERLFNTGIGVTPGTDEIYQLAGRGQPSGSTAGRRGSVVPRSQQGPSATVAIPPPAQTVGDGTGPDVSGYNEPNSADEVPNTYETGRGLEPPDAPETPQYYNETSDTSRPVGLTREVQLINRARDEALGRADIAAAHGDMATADTHFAQALTLEAGGLQQTRMQLYRLASGGNLEAAARLFESVGGMDEGTVRIQPVAGERGRRLFNMQINTGTAEAPQWATSSEVPWTRDQMVSAMQNLVDAAAARENTEAAMNLQEAYVRARADITVAQINADVADRRMFSETSIARMEAQARQAIADGTARVTPDSTNGGAFVSYPRRDAQGNTSTALLYVQPQDVRVADVDGRRTERRMVGTPVDGYGGR